MAKKSIDSIYTKLEDMVGWLKNIDNKLNTQNGKINQNEKDIALLSQRHKIEGEMETWSRKKLLFLGGVILVIVNSVILILFEIIKRKW